MKIPKVTEMSDQLVIGGTAIKERGKAHSFVLRTVGGNVVRVSEEIYRQAAERMGEVYVSISLTTDPGRDGDPVVECDVLDMEERMQRAKTEAAELRDKLTKLLEECP